MLLCTDDVFAEEKVSSMDEEEKEKSEEERYEDGCVGGEVEGGGEGGKVDDDVGHFWQANVHRLCQWKPKEGGRVQGKKKRDVVGLCIRHPVAENRARQFPHVQIQSLSPSFSLSAAMFYRDNASDHSFTSWHITSVLLPLWLTIHSALH